MIPNKNKLWQRYSKGEKLKPTYDTIIKNRVKSTFDNTFFGVSELPPPPPEPQEPRKVKQGGLNVYKYLDSTIDKYVPAILMITTYFLIIVAVFVFIVKRFYS